MSEYFTLPSPAVAWDRSRRALTRAGELGFGIVLVAAVAAAAYALRLLPGISLLSPLIVAILIGVALRNLVGTPVGAKAGIGFCARRVLRAAIVLLGVQITLQQVLQVGTTGLAIVASALVATFVVTETLGRMLGVDAKLARLIASGTSICGASAVVAANTVTEGQDEDVAYAIACVTLFGTASMLLYPLAGSAFGLGSHAYGLWTGASIHEIAQVVAAAFQHGTAAGETGTISKLGRVMLLAPVVATLGWLAARSRPSGHGPAGARRAIPVPWFALGFLAVIAANSLGLVPTAAKRVLVPSTAALLTVSLAALGLETDIAKIRATGLRPLLLGALATLFISGFSLALIMLTE